MSWKAGLSRNVRELRFLLSTHEKDPASAGMRTFLQKNYRELLELNPLLSLPVRQSEAVSNPSIVARYDFGERHVVDVSGASEDVIMTAVKSLHDKGAEMPRSEKSTLPEDII